ncbi:MAG: hypothetical protein HOW73_50215 [Polyangiaceae bacterium]|nr:hypothetical protein [Polyangiaceae bacterium]
MPLVEHAVQLASLDWCALLKNGRVRCWQAGHAAQTQMFYDLAEIVGDVKKNWTVREFPALPPLVHFASGQFHMCGATKEGSVFCWGGNTVGELGDGTDNERAAPIQVQGLPSIKQLALLAGGTCALSTEGEVFCWGLRAPERRKQ